MVVESVFATDKFRATGLTGSGRRHDVYGNR